MRKLLLCAVIFIIGCEDAFGIAAFGAMTGAGVVGHVKIREHGCGKLSTLEQRCACFKDIPVTKATTTPKECYAPDKPEAP